MKASSPQKYSEPLMEMFLRIKHPTLDTAEITKTLGLEPEECINAGTTASKSGVQRLHSESYWIAELEVPNLTEMGSSFLGPSGADIFSQPGKMELRNVIGATECDIHILGWLKRLQSKHAFFKAIDKAGGSVTLLIQRNDRSSPLSIRRALGKLDEFGIALEID